ncbi:ABC transporter permease [Longirhabdus pacifica]|uniref:ABC transporter permease n=1 Tax=Longirhabdus pacifica TaxID=2305227 RepID=UPI0013E8A2E5|nr:ABC transporter permease subunit [Longirhabdus pacifica]
MWHKALFRKDYKQTKFILWAIVLICILALPLNTAVQLEELRIKVEKDELDGDFANDTEKFEVISRSINSSILPDTMAMTNVILSVMIILLAGVMIGAERGNKTNDFTFTLPFSRKQIFLSKWMMGSAVIVASYIVNFILAQCIIYFSEFGQHMIWKLSFFYLIYPLVGLLAIYTFSLFWGTVTGGVIYQIAVSIIFLIFPLGIIMLLSSFLDANTVSYYYWDEWAFLRGLDSVLNHTFLFKYNIALENLLYDFNNRWFDMPIQDMKIYYTHLLIPLGYIATSLFLGVMLYEKGNIEHNGKFILFDKLQPVFQVGMVVCFALLGGMLLREFTPYNLSESEIYFYYAGFIGTGLLFYFISRKLLNMKLQLFSR